MSELNENNRKLIGIDVSDSALKAVCINKNGKSIDAHAVNKVQSQETFSELINFINQIKERFGNFTRLGIAVPGLINRKTNRVAFSTHFPEHEKLDFLGTLESETGTSIHIENDANAAAYAEYLLGAGYGSKNMFYATMGIGVGGALIFDGKIWHGVSGFAGEFGHIAIDADGLKLEGVASMESIVQRTRSRFHQDQTSSLNKFEEEEITLKHIIAAAKNEDDFAVMMLERTGNYIGTAIAGVINLLNIETIVIGGEIMQAEHLVLDAIIERAEKLSFAPSFESTKIVKGKLGKEATAIGAALLSDKS